MTREWWEYESDPLPDPGRLPDPGILIRNINIDLRYSVYEGLRGRYSQEDQRLAQPVAEVLCMLHRQPMTDYEKYMDIACELMELNRSNYQFSWVQDTCHKNQSVYEAWAQWRMIKRLSERSRP